MARQRKRFANINAVIGSSPMIAVGVGLYVIGIIYALGLSFTNSRLLPEFSSFVGLDNYRRLWGTSRWLISVENIFIYGILLISISMILGFIIAAAMDRKVRGEAGFRTIYLYPYALSLIVTGLVWQWMMNPELGVQAAVRNLGFTSFSFAPLTSIDTAIYGVVVAGVWQGSGVTMAIILAGLRGIDEEIWKAARVDGIPTWRVYVFIAAPMLRGALATAFILQAVGVVRVYDLIVAQTQGGPGIATEMPAKYVIDSITARINVSLAMAAAAMMLLPVIFAIGLNFYLEWRRKRAMVAAAS